MECIPIRDTRTRIRPADLLISEDGNTELESKDGHMYVTVRVDDLMEQVRQRISEYQTFKVLPSYGSI